MINSNCTVVNNQEFVDPQAVLLIGAIVSYLCYGYILYLRYVVKLPALSRHPTELSIYKVFFEVLFVSQFFWLAFVPTNDFWNSNNNNSNDCETTGRFAIFCFLCQFSLLGAELWFFVLSRDMYLTVSNPFSSYKRMATRFIVFVFGTAALSGCILIACGPTIYGLSSDPMIWIQDQIDHKFNYGKVFFFYFWMGLIYAYSFYVLWFVNDRIKIGLEATLEARLSSIRRTRIYTCGYTLFWTVVFVLEFVDFAGLVKQDDSMRRPIRTTVGFVLASRGVWSLFILAAGNYDDMKMLYMAGWSVPSATLRLALAAASTRANSDKVMMSPHLNEALRRELLLYTTQGIRTAVQQFQLSKEFGKRNIGTMQPSLGRRSSSIFSGASMGVEGTFSFAFNEINPEVDDQSRNSISSNHVETGTGNFSTSVKSRGGKSELKAPLISSGSGTSPGKAVEQTEAAFPFRARNTDISESEQRIQSPLCVDEISSVSSGFDPLRRFRSRRLRSDFFFKDFAPDTFHRIRELTSVDDEDYIDSFKETTAESFNEGRSGAFMYLSKDEKFIVKTLSQTEMSKLLEILPNYFAYLSGHPNSLLTKYLGAHAIVMYDTTLYFVVMLNFFPNIVLSERYDLKGSWVDRNGTLAGVTRTERMEGYSGEISGNNVVPLFRDNDLSERIMLRAEAALSLSVTIREDILFLRDRGLMDYSLLIGVRRKRFEVVDRDKDTDQAFASQFEMAAKENPYKQDSDGGIHAGVVEGAGTYYFGIIDTLQEWNWRKKIERYFKIGFRFLSADGISAIPPADYAQRFWNRVIRDIFEYVDEHLDENLDVPPRYLFRSTSGRAQESSQEKLIPKFPSQEPSKCSDSDWDEDVSFDQRETDRRFSVIPMDVDKMRSSRGLLSFSAQRPSTEPSDADSKSIV